MFDNVTLDRLRRAYGAVAKAGEIAARFPDDPFVRANLISLQRDVEALELDWENSCQRESIEVCRYRIMPETTSRFALSRVTQSLFDFQGLFSQVHDALKYGAKQRARVSQSTLDETAFEFGFSYPGSLGIALTIDRGPDLFGGAYDKTIDTFMNLFEISLEGEVREIATRYGDAVVKKMFDWSSINVASGYSVDLQWSTSKGEKKGGLVSIHALEKVASVVRRTSDRHSKEVNVRGALVGIDTVRRTFRFVDPEGADYTGSLDTEFEAGRQWSVNTRYTARIKVDSVTYYARQETKETYTLLLLSDPA